MYDLSTRFGLLRNPKMLNVIFLFFDCYFYGVTKITKKKYEKIIIFVESFNDVLIAFIR